MTDAQIDWYETLVDILLKNTEALNKLCAALLKEAKQKDSKIAALEREIERLRTHEVLESDEPREKESL